MRYLLDTNVFREIGKTDPHRHVAAWLARVDDADLAISALTVREVRKGIVRLRSRKPDVAGRIEARVNEAFAAFGERLLPVGREVADVPALWHAPTTTAHERQAIARLLLERVVVTVEGESERVAVTCHWAGGARTEHALSRPVKRLAQLSTCRALLGRIGDLHAAGSRAPAIAATLNREGW